MRYEAVSALSRQEIVAKLASDDPETVAAALYSAAQFDSDWAWSDNI
jgi:hypothetical protein